MYKYKMAVLCTCASLTNIVIAKDDNIYSYVDGSGNTIVSNIPHSGSSRMKLPPLPVYVRPMSKSDLLAPRYTNQVNINKPPAKSNLELGRTEVLTEELNHEKNALATTEKLLITAKSMSHQDINTYNSRIQLLNDAITEHQKNIDLLTKQLHN